jgi:hypothetical protein
MGVVDLGEGSHHDQAVKLVVLLALVEGEWGWRGTYAENIGFMVVGLGVVLDLDLE